MRHYKSQIAYWAFLLYLIAMIAASPADALPSFQEIKNTYAKSDAVLLDRHGEVIHELRVDPKGRRLDWVGLGDMSPSLIEAVIHSEDRRFFSHSGVDWRAMGAAFIKNLFGDSKRGASTITMQVASVIDKRLKPSGSKRTLKQKIDQISAAKEIERYWSKNEILEAYLNLITFKGELQGIGAAARGLFDKEPNGLDARESLLLAALIRSPNAWAETAAQRACQLGLTLANGVNCEEIKALAQMTLTGRYTVRQRAALAPHVAYALLSNGKSSIKTTLDGTLQRVSIETLRHQLSVVRAQNVNEGAVLVVDNNTGDVLAYVGNVSGASDVRYVDGIRAQRQAGSTLKPFLYALAFEKRLLLPASIINDTPLDVTTATGIYRPDNYESDFKGLVSVRTALASSLNIPAVRVVSLTGVDPFVKKLRELGFSNLERDEYYGPSIALGSADVTLYELVNAYRTLANGGIWSELRLTHDEASLKRARVFPEHIAFMVADILSDREARSLTFGFENSLATRFWTAVKTGTSKDMRDNWCIGFSRKYTVGVWVGNFSGQPMWNVSGVTGAAPVWLEIMNWLHKDVPSIPPKKPDTVVAQKVEYSDGIEPSRVEVFKRGDEFAVVSLKTAQKEPHILYPASGTIISLDPDMPDGNERVFFEAQASSSQFQWLLNGELLGMTDAIISWEPRKGKYTLVLVDNQSRTIDSVKFEVRGSKATINAQE